MSDWTTHATRIAYENPWIRVEHHDVTTPGGSPGIYGVVRFRNLAVGVVPIDEEGYVHLVGQHRYPQNRYSWEIPEGGCPEDEDPLEACKRELQEETGLTATDWEEILRTDTSNSVTDESGIVYLATGLRQGIADPEDTENLSRRRVPLPEAVEMVLRGEITDSISQLGILMAARKWKK